MDLKGGAVAMSRLFCRSQETFTLACVNVENFLWTGLLEFRPEDSFENDE